MGQAQNDVKIEHAIMHELDREHDVLRLADRQIELDEAAKHFLARLMAHCAAAADAQGVDAGGSAALVAARDILAYPDLLLPRSRELAEKLYGSMVGKENISSGDLFVVIACDNCGPVLGVFKTEPSAEYSRTYRTESDGTITPLLIANDSIIPSERRPPQKCAFIREARSDQDYDVLLLDNQIGQSGDVAKFYYQGFLECELVTSAAARTLTFCRAVELWRRENKNVLPAQGIPSFARALQLHLNRSEVTFREFALEALSVLTYPSLKPDDLAEYLASKVHSDKPYPRPDRFEPEQVTAMRLLESISLTLDGGVQISGPAQFLSSVLERASTDGGGQLEFRLGTTSVRRNFHKPKPRRD